MAREAIIRTQEIIISGRRAREKEQRARGQQKREHPQNTAQASDQEGDVF